MNDKCKYCDYVSKCSRKCEYGSILCTVNRSFPKIVNKSYEQLQQENQQLKDQLKNVNNSHMFVDTNIEEEYGYGLENDYLKKKLEQSEEVIDKCINKLGRYAGEMTNNGNAYAICVDLLDTLQRYKGDREDE